MFSTQHLSCVRGERLLFSAVNLQLRAGGLLYIQGENGAGKSSLLRILTGLLQPESGTVLWGGESIWDSESYQSQLLYIGHLNALKEDLSPRENLLFSAGLNRQINDADIIHALKAVNLQRQVNLPVRTLSQGQKRRVALTRLWLATHARSDEKNTGPTLWILDEPFASLDNAMTALLADHISQHLANGGMAILTTHQAVEIRASDIQNYRLTH